MFTVYVLKSKVAPKSYVGATNNLERRLHEHNDLKHAYTKRYAPWKVIYSEDFETWSEARSYEKFLKSTTGRRALKKIFKAVE
ncbi:MAG: GIY-YIG nuclease family protein [Patescibacteria group bacterium]